MQLLLVELVKLMLSKRKMPLEVFIINKKDQKRCQMPMTMKGIPFYLHKYFGMKDYLTFKLSWILMGKRLLKCNTATITISKSAKLD